MSEEVIVFLHLPKVGGTTFNEILYSNVDRAKSWIWAPYEQDREIREFREAVAAGQVVCVSGHMAFGLHEYLPACRYVTILRDPVGRALSCFGHFQRTQLVSRPQFIGIEREFDVQESLEWTVEDFLERRLCNHMHNGYTRYLAGRGGLPIYLAEKEELGREDLATAMDNLRHHMDVIITTEEYNQGLLLLRHELGMRRIFYVRKNQDRRKAKAPIPEETRRVVAQYNQLDIELYDFARKLTRERFLAAGLADELPKFEQELATYQEAHASAADDRIHEINQLLAGIPPNSQIAVYGCGEHTKRMFQMTELGALPISCILDTYRGGFSYEGHPVVQAEPDKLSGVDVVVVSNFPFQQTIVSHLRDELGFTGRIVTFYKPEDTMPFYEC